MFDNVTEELIDDMITKMAHELDRGSNDFVDLIFRKEFEWFTYFYIFKSSIITGACTLPLGLFCPSSFSLFIFSRQIIDLWTISIGRSLKFEFSLEEPTHYVVFFTTAVRVHLSEAIWSILVSIFLQLSPSFQHCCQKYTPRIFFLRKQPKDHWAWQQFYGNLWFQKDCGWSTRQWHTLKFLENCPV